MLEYIGFIENLDLQERVRRWLTEIYGSTVTRCVGTLDELKNLYTANHRLQIIITDLPPGKLLRNRHDEINAITHGYVRIILINPDSGDIFVPPGERRFSIVPIQRLEQGLRSLLHVH